jgi:superfamily II DNA/RNA helicase
VNPLLHSLTIPDLWQQEAVRAMREGRDVVVHAPTGAGKTWIFELLYPNLHGQAVFTVPTRALANDKLAEWQGRGWEVGIATGDVAMRLDARVVVATLETQKGRLLEGRGPGLLVIDEYQMIADPVRGVNYEVAIALTPPQTQLLLLSGSVANPGDVVEWLRRIGRNAVLVSHAERPVPLQEVDLGTLPGRHGEEMRGGWARLISNALRAELGPVLLFAPRRHAAEELARQLAAALPADRPLSLSREQEQMAGPRLSRLLHARVAYHHSGLSYAQRAGLIEPLAKAGELRAVVATMGLAAGINFSMRSVAITGTAYMAGNFERQVRPDELLQMYGRAGRRGLDESGYALVVSEPPRLLDARPRHLRRASQVDWPTLIAVMERAAGRGEDPLRAAREVNGRLFSVSPVPLGIEHALETGPVPCGLRVDMERARFARRGVVEMWTPRGEWETQPPVLVDAPLGRAMAWEGTVGAGGSWHPALARAAILQGRGSGNLVRLPAEDGTFTYGREYHLGSRKAGEFSLAPWLRRALHHAHVDLAGLEHEVLEKLPELSSGGRLLKLVPRGDQLLATVAYDLLHVPAFLDREGTPLLDPPTRRELPVPCRTGPCPQLAWCSQVEITPSPAHAWRLLGLIEPDGRPTRRGVIFSYFQHGEGLAVAAALEQARYPVDELIFDLANLRGGRRFAGEDSPFGGRLAVACQQTYGRLDFEGYLEMGAPTDYAAGASEAVRQIVEFGVPRQKLLTESLRLGDLERAVVEWRSLLRHILHAPDYDWARWRELREEARRRLTEA